MKGKKILTVFTFVFIYMLLTTIPINAETEYVTSKDGRFRYKVYETEAENYIHIDKYLGNESVLVIPDVIDGYVVRGLLFCMLYENETVEEIEIPNTLSYIDSGVFASAYALENIHMEDGFSEAFHTRDGILYNGGTLISYPPGKEDDVFTIPNSTGNIQKNAFYGCVNLEKVIVPSNTDFIFNSFSRCKKPLDIVIKNDVYESGYLDDICWQMLEGTRILVANEELAEQYAAEMTNDDYYAYTVNNGSYYYTIDIPMAVEVYAPVPSTDLTFADGTREKDITVDYGLWGIPYEQQSFMRDYIQYPFDTTENVYWDTVRDGGRLIITGCDDSGHKIVANVTAYCPVEEFSLECEEKTIYADDQYGSVTATIDGVLTEEYSYAYREGVTWEIADESIAKITESGVRDSDYSNMFGCNIYCNVQAVSAGKTTLTATISDDGVPRTETVEIIVGDSLKNCEIEEIPAQIYTGEQICPKPVITYKDRVLEEDVDYTLSYGTNTTDRGTISIEGIGVLSSSRTINFSISNSVKDAVIKFIPTQNKSDILNGIYPELEVTLLGITLIEGENYKVEIGVADKDSGYAKITGINGYTGQQKVYFELNNDIVYNTITEDMVTMNTSYLGYKIEDKEIVKATTLADILNTIHVVYENKELIRNKDYDVYMREAGSNGYYKYDYEGDCSDLVGDGDYEMVVTGINDKLGGYTGTVVIPFTIQDNHWQLYMELMGLGGSSKPEPNPDTNQDSDNSSTGTNSDTNTNTPDDETEPKKQKVSVAKTKITGLKSKAKKAVTVKWKKISGANGYQVQCATNKKFTKNKKAVTIKKGKATSTTVKKLKSKKKYSVRIRAYKIVNGTKYYSNWSKVKTIKVK